MSMTNRQVLCCYAVLVLVFGSLIAALFYTSYNLRKHTVHITERDIVRYCMNSRRRQAPAKDISYYCRDLGGDYYRAVGGHAEL